MSTTGRPRGAPDDGDEARPRMRRVQAVDHAVDVLECIAAAGVPIGVSDVARQAGLSKAATHHLLGTLEARRLVMRDSNSPAYRLGWGLYELGATVASGVDVSRVARPVLDRLALDTGESVLLGILDGRTVLYLDRGDPPTGFHMVASAGRRSPLHATASGKLLLAFEGDEAVERYLSEPLQRFTESTVVEPEVLRAQIAEIRERGYATCWQERELGLCSVAVRVRDHSARTVAALTLAGPNGRLVPESVDAHLASLRDAAAEIEAQLGFGPELAVAGASPGRHLRT